MIDLMAASIIAEMHATITRIEGMKADNAARQVANEPPYWNGKEFFNEAAVLDIIARALRERAG